MRKTVPPSFAPSKPKPSSRSVFLFVRFTSSFSVRRENKRKKPFMRYAYLQTSVHGPSSTVHFLPHQLQTKGHNQVDRKAEPFLLSLEWLQQWQKFIHCSTLGACTVYIRPIYLALCVVFQQSINLLFLASLSSPFFSLSLPFPPSPPLSPFLPSPFSLPLLHFLSFLPLPLLSPSEVGPPGPVDNTVLLQTVEGKGLTLVEGKDSFYGRGVVAEWWSSSTDYFHTNI